MIKIIRAMSRRAIIVVLATCVTLATAGVVPPDELRALFNDPQFHYSTDIFEDASLMVPDLIRKYGYPVEEHVVTTADGYILTMHRIPHGKDRNNVPEKNKPVVLLMHGLLCSSAVWVFSGPSNGFGYILAEEGYDVWLGNARGTTYSRAHTSLNPDATFGTAFWQFSWDEIGNYDLPSMIDHILQTTGRNNLHYIGHSQGTTSFFTMASLRPEYNEKISSMHALAPVAYMAHNKNPLLLFISPYANDIERVGALIGFGEFLPHHDVYRWAGQAFCRDEVPTQVICSSMIFLIGGWNPAQLNATILPLALGHLPAGASVRQLVHYAQGITGHEFRRYDYGNPLTNWRHYRSFTPPNYDLGKITAPVFLHYSDNDPLAEYPDVDRLFRELGRPVGKFRVPLAEFTHVDFMWAIDVKELVYDRVINYMGAIEANTFDENDINSY